MALPRLRRLSPTLAATATDPGSDDLTFTWGWGDGAHATATICCNNGVSPDPYPSPGGTFPFTATDTWTRAYMVAGTYILILRVSDDDGGTSEVILVVDLGSGRTGRPPVQGIGIR